MRGIVQIAGDNGKSSFQILVPVIHAWGSLEGKCVSDIVIVFVIEIHVRDILPP